MIQPEQQALLDQLKEDYLVRALGFNGEVRAFAARTTKTIFETQLRHRTTPVAVLGLVDAMEISAGSSHTCARRRSGERSRHR